MKKITLILFYFIYAFGFSQSISNYDISVTTIWNTSNHTSIPPDPHWSPLAGATHKNPNDILEFNVTAPLTNGIKNIAEIGNTSNFINEVNQAITDGSANQYLQQSFSPRAANNSIATLTNILVREDFPLITLVSMVAPSPDWFIAINSLNLRSGNNAINNGWKDTFTVDVFAYDSGTDSGTNYTSNNLVSSPRLPISIISGFPINGNRMATITFTYNSSTLSTDSLEFVKKFKLYPNPSNGNITMSNIQNIKLKNIEIFNVLGMLVEQINVRQNSSKIDLDLSQLNKGIYLLKVLDKTGIIAIRKLVID